MWTDFDDVVTGALVDRWVGFFQEVQDVQRKRAVASTYLVDDKVLVREVFE